MNKARISLSRICLLLWVSCLMHTSVWGQTLSPSKALGRYQQIVWQDQHGLPGNAVVAMARTRDGYLWVGTSEGAARFDGVRFTVFDSSNTPALRRNQQILALLEDRGGNLWLGTNGGGAVRYRDGQFETISKRDGLSHDQVRALLEDRAGNLWLGTDGGLTRWRDGRSTVFHTQHGLPDEFVWALAEDRAGGIWVATAHGLARFADDRFTTYGRREGLLSEEVLSLLVDRAGTLWAGTDGGLCRFREGRFVAHTAAGLPRARIRSLYEDSAGQLWIGTYTRGLALIEGDRCTLYSTTEGLPSDSVISFLQDPEGDVWVGTEGSGLCQFRAGRFRTYTVQDGLPHEYITSIFEDAAGRVWIGTLNGLGMMQAGSIRSYPTKNGLQSIRSFAEDRTGNIWISTRKQLFRYRGGRFTPQTLQNGQAANKPMRLLLGDRAGNVWMGVADSGLNLYHDGQNTLYTTRDGLAGNTVYGLYEDRARGIWIATLDGMSRFHNGRFTSWTIKDGLGSNQILAFYEDRRGSMWIGTSGGGLSRLRDGKIVTITVNDGLYDNLAFQILSDTEDDTGNLWMSCNRGIYRISLRELDDFAEGRSRTVTSYAYGTTDGMLSRECNGGFPGGWKTRDGRLWFPTVRGVVVIDPRLRQLQPPLVAIEGAEVDRHPVPISQTVHLGPEQENLEIRYTALSWARPQQVRFKYQMIGLDHDLVDVGTRRTAYYSHLPPGEYVFKVIADNGEGVWNTAGRSILIVILPPFYRRWWFLMLMISGFVGVVWQFYRYRFAQFKREQAAQQTFSRQLIESQEGERKRIAAELHDGLGQNLLVIKNRALLNAMTVPDERARAHFTEFGDAVAQTLEEVRTISYDLRPPHLDQLGLRTALVAMIEKVGDSSAIRFTHAIDKLDGLFRPDDEITLYRVVQECLNNILKHSGATAAAVNIAVRAGELALMIRDDGRGFAPEDAQRRAGLGLQGIAERVRILGGTHTIESAPGQGTTVTLRIALQDNQR